MTKAEYEEIQNKAYSIVIALKNVGILINKEEMPAFIRILTSLLMLVSSMKNRASARRHIERAISRSENPSVPAIPKWGGKQKKVFSEVNNRT